MNEVKEASDVGPSLSSPPLEHTTFLGVVGGALSRTRLKHVLRERGQVAARASRQHDSNHHMGQGGSIPRIKECRGSAA